MSRIGNSPVKVPDGVTLSHQGNELSAKGSMYFRFKYYVYAWPWRIRYWR